MAQISQLVLQIEYFIIRLTFSESTFHDAKRAKKRVDWLVSGRPTQELPHHRYDHASEQTPLLNLMMPV
jgi:hypothetical protein